MKIVDILETIDNSNMRLFETLEYHGLDVEIVAKLREIMELMPDVMNQFTNDGQESCSCSDCKESMVVFNKLKQWVEE